MNVPAPSNSLFTGIGLELEYMIVDANTLSILPIADEVLKATHGQYTSDVERGDLCWSNELALHVIELKTNGPVANLAGLDAKFQADAQFINDLLQPFGACLMPTGMHPWMNPFTETRLWPHEYNPIYEAFNRIFSCRGHGWSNLQSVHINLPFANNIEFAQLHAAVRLVLPILPALAASSPVIDGQPTAWLDNRLEVYRTNSARIPSITGQVIPEPVFTKDDYYTQILAKLYHDIAPLDPDGVLQDEWLNARGAIARFDRNTIEIRLLDVQECPQADLAIAGAVIEVLRALTDQRWSTLEFQQSFSTESLAAILLETIRDAELAVVSDTNYLRAFGISETALITAGELWRRIIAKALPQHHSQLGFDHDALEIILNKGSLARRILRAFNGAPTRDQLKAVYGDICDCLASGKLYPANSCSDGL